MRHCQSSLFHPADAGGEVLPGKAGVETITLGFQNQLQGAACLVAATTIQRCAIQGMRGQAVAIGTPEVFGDVEEGKYPFSRRLSPKGAFGIKNAADHPFAGTSRDQDVARPQVAMHQARCADLVDQGSAARQQFAEHIHSINCQTEFIEILCHAIDQCRQPVAIMLVAAERRGESKMLARDAVYAPHIKAELPPKRCRLVGVQAGGNLIPKHAFETVLQYECAWQQRTPEIGGQHLGNDRATVASSG